MAFRLQTRAVFLTYPHCDAVKEDLLDHLKTTFKCSEIIVGRENHADGTPHLHAFIRFLKKFSTKSQTVFDFRQFHPNIQPAKNIHAVKNYVKKDGNYIEYADLAEDAEDIIEVCRSMLYSEWLNHCLRKKIPFPYMKEVWAISHLNELTTIRDFIMPTGGTICEELMSWEPTLNASNLLIGPSGIGKTLACLQKSPKPTLLISHLDGLRDFSPSLHQSIIFDDMSFTHLPLQAQIHIVDSHCPRLLHRRYGTTLVPAGITKFFTCNTNPFDIAETPIKRRLSILYL